MEAKLEGVESLETRVLVVVARALESTLEFVDYRFQYDMPVAQVVEWFANKPKQSIESHEVRQALRVLIRDGDLVPGPLVDRSGLRFPLATIGLTDQGLIQASASSFWSDPFTVRSWNQPVLCLTRVRQGGEVHFDGAKIDTGQPELDSAINSSPLAVSLIVVLGCALIEQESLTFKELSSFLTTSVAIGLGSRVAKEGKPPSRNALERALGLVQSALPFVCRRQPGKLVKWSAKVTIPLLFLDKDRQPMGTSDTYGVIRSRTLP